MTQTEKALAFRALHEGREPFLLPNPWDVGTARLLTQLGFRALATTSAGYAFSKGRRDGAVPRDEMLIHAAEITRATDLPVSGDLENGYGATLEEVAETYRLAASAGLVGASIDDATGNADAPILDLRIASERVRAAADAVRGLPFPFTLTARAENYLHGRPDLRDTISRLRAYQEAGADVLYAPGLSTKAEIAAVVKSVDRPVNVIAGLRSVQFSMAQLADLGVKRISIGSALSRVALGAFLRASREMLTQGTFTFSGHAVSYQELNERFKGMKKTGIAAD